MFFLKDLPTREMLDEYQKKFPEFDFQAIEDGLLLMRKASLLIRCLDGFFAKHGLSQLQFFILIVLNRTNAAPALRVSDIAERLDISKPVLTRTLQSLERRGMIEFESHDSDKRVKLVRITDCGCRKIESLQPGDFQIIESFMKS